ncbi:hypothetical protein I7I48_02875 [Histoplasma ohiense]|nr:hypothetical protein I7I48_02875 [Histoplasma ohiense (nom. inval.)]
MLGSSMYELVPDPFSRPLLPIAAMDDGCLTGYMQPPADTVPHCIFIMSPPYPEQIILYRGYLARIRYARIREIIEKGEEARAWPASLAHAHGQP